jgi:hypothetical protein
VTLVAEASQDSDDAELTPRARTRLGDAGRERAVGVQQRAFAKGQLAADEFERRIEIAYRARSATTCARSSMTCPNTKRCAPTVGCAHFGLIDRVTTGSAPDRPTFDYRGRVHRLSEATLGAPKAA